MHSIERYGVVALIFLVVTVVAVLTWDREVARPEPAGEPAPEIAGELKWRDDPSAGVALVSRPRPLRRDLFAAEGEAFRSFGAEPERSSGWPLEEPAARSLPPGSHPETGAAARHGELAAQPAPEPARPAPRDERRIYVVRKGDTLSEIAQREVGTAKRWEEIVRLNPGLNPKRLRVGARLLLPTRPAESIAGGSSPAPERQASAPAPAGAQQVAPAAARTPVTAGATNVYTIQAGESLWGIAARELGDGDRWRELVALNAGLAPERLAVGQRIRMPAASGGSTVVAAATPRGTESESARRARRVR